MRRMLGETHLIVMIGHGEYVGGVAPSLVILAENG